MMDGMANLLKTSLIVTAAGKGTRFSETQNKLLLDFNGIPLLVKTILNLTEHFRFSEVVVTVHRDDRAEIERLLNTHELNEIKVVTGGESRRESVENGFSALNPCDIVAIHDGARPFVSKLLIDRLIDAAQKDVSVIPGIEIVDTVKRVDPNGLVIETISRSELRRIQTPQLFPYHQLKRAYELQLAAHATDEAMIMEALNVPVKVVAGDPENRKITVLEDWQS